jgi:hypothetical protein
MSRFGLLGGAVLSLLPLACEKLDRFDTKGSAAYCGYIVGAKFVRTSETEGGFARDLGLRLEIDTGSLSDRPGTLTSDDAATGPCVPRATFDHTPLVVTPEVNHDPLSAMTFEDGQVRNVVAWADSTCRGPMLAVVSLYVNDRVDVRLLKPAPVPSASGAGGAPGSVDAGAPALGGAPPVERDAFALFRLERRADGCGF